MRRDNSVTTPPEQIQMLDHTECLSPSSQEKHQPKADVVDLFGRGRRVLGDGLGALGHSVLSELTR